MVNSHIQMPNCILKNFCDNQNWLYYYDFGEKKIRRGHAKTLYTQTGYYSDEVEQILCDEIEAPLGILVKYIKTISIEKTDNPPGNYSEVAFNYLYSLLSRSPHMIENIKRHSFYYQFMSDIIDPVYNHDYATVGGIAAANNIDLLKDKLSVTFLLNRSREDFVLPTGGVIQLENRLICPVTPDKAIIFDDKEVLLEDGDRALIDYYETDDEEAVHIINLKAFIGEKSRDGKYVVSNNKELLEMLKTELGL